MKIKLYFVSLMILIFIGCNQNQEKYNNSLSYKDSSNINENVNLISLENGKGVCFYKNGYIHLLYFGQEAYGVKFKTDDFKDITDILNKSDKDSLKIK